MRRMLERISPVLLASVVAGGFVVASTLPATAEGSQERRDRLHSVRPNAAPTTVVMVDFDEVAAQEQVAYAAVVETALAEQAYAALIDQRLAARGGGSGRGSYASARYGSCNGDVACFLECTRAHESDTSGGYGAVSSSGTYRGAYQFNSRTWAAAVAGAGHEEYAEMPADQAPAEVQDAAAAHLYGVSGTRPWGGRC